jgi:hypothetical protein
MAPLQNLFNLESTGVLFAFGYTGEAGAAQRSPLFADWPGK